jgi:hypothetical protein
MRHTVLTSNGWRSAPRQLTQKDFDKAQIKLSGLGLDRAFEIHQACPLDGYTEFEERTITDIVGKMARYGSISEKQENFLRNLVEKVDTRAQRQADWQAKRDAERADATDCPAGRITITGTIVKLDTKVNQFGCREVMTVKSEDGFLVWGTCPSALYDKVRGDTVKFVATVTPSDTDSKFGFFKRPSV